MWRFRNEAIFIAAVAFALRTAVHPEFISLLAAVLFLSAHYLDRFFGSERFESKAIARVLVLEEELKSIKTEIGHIKLAGGIRGSR